MVTTIKFIKNAEGHQKDDVATVKNSDAHRMIEAKVAKIHRFTVKKKPDKMMRPKKKGRKKDYKTKGYKKFKIGY